MRLVDRVSDILSIFKADGWRFGNCTVRVYDRRQPDFWGEHFLERLYDQCKQSNILKDLFCGMIDLSSDAICSYLHTLNPILVMCVDSEDPAHDRNKVFTTAGFAFPTMKLGGFPLPNPLNLAPPPRSESSMVLGYGYMKPWWGTPEAVVLGMLTLAYFFENHNLTAIHGQRYFWNALTAKFTSQFGVKDTGYIPRFLQTPEGKLADCCISTVILEDFESYVQGVFRELAANSLKSKVNNGTASNQSDQPNRLSRRSSSRPSENLNLIQVDGEPCRLLPLTRELYATVDADLYDHLMQWNWHALRCSDGTYYACRDDRTDGRKMVFLHQQIMGVSESNKIDHRNRNPLDARRSNLRLCTESQNKANRRKGRNNTTGYKGVCFHIRKKKYAAGITCLGKRIYLGMFGTPEEAAIVYDDAALKYFGEFACLNFPGRTLEAIHG